jgi:hypothetical protein
MDLFIEDRKWFIDRFVEQNNKEKEQMQEEERKAKSGIRK